MQKFLLVFLGSGVGGVLRYLISFIFAPVSYVKFPWHTFIANLIAAFLVGLFYSVAAHKNWFSKEYLLLLTTGLCGGLSTFSTFSYETLKLWENGQYLTAFLYIATSIVTCLFFTWVGTKIITA